jgi:hypothetical protein
LWLDLFAIELHNILATEHNLNQRCSTSDLTRSVCQLPPFESTQDWHAIIIRRGYLIHKLGSLTDSIASHIQPLQTWDALHKTETVNLIGKIIV